MGSGGGGSNKVKETSQEKAAAEIAMKRYQRYEKKYVPVENNAFADVTSKSSAVALERKAGGMVNADSAKAFDTAMKNMPASRPGSQQQKAAIDQTDRAKASGEVAGKISGLGERQTMKGLQIATSIGTGQANDAQVSMDSMASDALRENIGKQEADFNRRAARTNAVASGIGAVAGAGMNLYGGGGGGTSTANNAAMTWNNKANGPLWRP